MFKNRDLVRTIGIRVYLNDSEQREIEEAAELAKSERAAFMRDAALVVARYIKRLNEQNHSNSQLTLAELNARLSNDFRFCLVS